MQFQTFEGCVHKFKTYGGIYAKHSISPTVTSEIQNFHIKTRLPHPPNGQNFPQRVQDQEEEQKDQFFPLMDSSKSSNKSSNSLKSVFNTNPSVHHRRNFQEADENEDPKAKKALEKDSMDSTVSSGYKKKILAEMDDDFSQDCDENIFRSTSQSSPVPYDPVTNYTSPRPLFLRYNPNRRREILRRIEGELKKEESQEFVKDDDDEDDEEREEEEVFEEKPGVFGMLWKSFLILGVLMMSTCYISCMNSSHLPYNGNQMRFQEETFSNVSNLDVFPKRVDMEWIVEKINSGMLIHEVKEVHDFQEIIAGKEEEETPLMVENDVPNDDESLVEECSEIHEDIVDTEMLEKKDVLCEFRQDSQNQLVPLMPLTDGNPEEKVEENKMVLYDGNLLLLLSATITVILIGLLVYFRRPKSDSAVISVHIEAKSTTDPNANLQIEKHNFSDVNLENEHNEFYESRPPLVELLGEFSVDKLDSKENEQRRTVVKRTSITVDKSYQSSSAKSLASVAESISVTTPKKPLRKEEEEIISARASITPLRRSNRIRNRITSPS
ncbi:hypothetical protein IHE45_04G101500 [Dioscorea alata]|uniref:Uncharacterized protein n=1 Tax=Dioscorea alata TaxID=55571 RepID=A0ACB7WEV9_DIOAL|nr:hypothetical protein IHE45_04G101500 [Dioscorea alata]